VYWEIEKSGDRGISQSELGKLLNLTWLQCRALLKNMVKTRIVKVYTADQGRQRLLRYILPKYYAEFKDRLANPAGEESDNELITGGCEESFEELGPQHRDQLFQSLLQTDDVALEDISVEIDEMEEMQKMPRLKLDPKRKLVT
uniref:B-block binding subunit of TFIIIC domain-containing protein n=2 Tax=Lutzomyia longipalpis TaxID=7200 RepID=A0A1B0CVR4_LUTLO